MFSVVQDIRIVDSSRFERCEPHARTQARRHVPAWMIVAELDIGPLPSDKLLQTCNHYDSAIYSAVLTPFSASVTQMASLRMNVSSPAVAARSGSVSLRSLRAPRALMATRFEHHHSSLTTLTQHSFSPSFKLCLPLPATCLLSPGSCLPAAPGILVRRGCIGIGILHFVSSLKSPMMPLPLCCRAPRTSVVRASFDPENWDFVPVSQMKDLINDRVRCPIHSQTRTVRPIYSATLDLSCFSTDDALLRLWLLVPMKRTASHENVVETYAAIPSFPDVSCCCLQSPGIHHH